jgi:hypothetical protein
MASSEVRKQAMSIAPNPLDVVPEKIPFDVPYGPPISLELAQAALICSTQKTKIWSAEGRPLTRFPITPTRTLRN